MSLFPAVGRKQFRTRLSWYTVVAFLWLGVVLHLLPFYLMMVISITPASEAMSMPPKLWPSQPTLAAWRLVLNLSEVAKSVLAQPLSRYFLNSLIMTFGTMALSIPVTSLAAYAVSKLIKGRAAKNLFIFFIGTLMLPGIVSLIPSFLLTRNFPFPLPVAPHIPGTDIPFPTLRLWNTYWAVIVPAGFSAGNFLLFKGFFDGIPDSIINAARVDGGSEFNIFRRIILPMSIPVYAVVAYFQFGATWDSYLWPLVVIQDSKIAPLTVAIRSITDAFNYAGTTNPMTAFGASAQMNELLRQGLSWNGLMVLGLLQALPVFLFFIIAREYLLKGVKIQGLK
ncbi:MAG: carbohydrate ABC transporter permease [Anaerolineales bacterium]|nr:carbohydrate ABC transporter permease [Anaerolineales bacterium]MCX7609289.1 carbohydrate ABC transporter permease [Anaerolineales bacterium]MDW8227144.1 carbohydrate ABC transporter permease [Anaerolineales bacterium]